MKAISLLPFGLVEDGVLRSLEEGLGRAFGREVLRLDSLPEPAFAFDRRRRQFSSVRILEDVASREHDDEEVILAVTEVDIFIPMLSFVFGQAQVRGAAAVMSTARLRQEFYGLPYDGGLLYVRAVKEAIHEIGHAVGLVHCADESCPMSLSYSIRQVDRKSGDFCGGCALLLRDLLAPGNSTGRTVRQSSAG
jgi:archaemetzincin